MNCASESGHFSIVKFLHENRTEGCTVQAMDKASLEGHLEIAVFLHQNGNVGCSVRAMDWASEGVIKRFLSSYILIGRNDVPPVQWIVRVSI